MRSRREARDWFDALDAKMRGLVLQVLALLSDPTDEQIEEAPDLIAKSWQLDAIGISPTRQPAVKAAIGELAEKLRAGGPTPIAAPAANQPPDQPDRMPAYRRCRLRRVRRV